MTAKIAGVAALLFAVFPWSTPSSARAQVGAKCAQTIDRGARDTAALAREGQKIGIEFAGADAVGAAAAGLTPILETSTNPTLALAGKVQNYQEAIDAFQAGLEEFTVILNELVACMETDRRWGDCLSEFARKADVHNKFAQSLADLGTQAAIERVQKASSLLNNYESRLADTVMKSAVDGVRACDEYQAKAAEQANAVDLRNSPTSQPTAPATPKAPKPSARGGGPGVGTALVAGVVVAGAAAGGYALYMMAPKCTSQESTVTNTLTPVQNAMNNVLACGTSASCINSRMGALQSTWSTYANAVGNLCTCLGVNANSYLSASEKAAVQQMWQSLPSLGLNPGAFPSCFR